MPVVILITLFPSNGFSPPPFSSSLETSMSAVQASCQHLVLFWTRGWCTHTHRNPSSTHHLRGSVCERVRWNLQAQKEGLSREHRRQHPQGTRKRRLNLQHSREYTGVSRPSPVLCCYGCSSWEWILPKANLDGRYLGTWKMNKECTFPTVPSPPLDLGMRLLLSSSGEA